MSFEWSLLLLLLLPGVLRRGELLEEDPMESQRLKLLMLEVAREGMNRSDVPSSLALLLRRWFRH